MEASEYLKGKILMVYSGVTIGIDKKVATYLGVTTHKLPLCMIVVPRDKGVTKYIMQGDLSQENYL